MSIECGEGRSISFPALLALRAQAKLFKRWKNKRPTKPIRHLHCSRLRGRGMDFAETRIYQPGDEARHIDWRVTARSGRLQTKLYHEERGRTLFLLVDYNDSMFFGTRVVFKSVLAAQIAALWAWSAASEGDSVGGLVFSGVTQRVCEAKQGERGVLPFLKQLADVASPFCTHTSSPQTFVSALTRLTPVMRPGSLVVLISDFQWFEPQIASSLGQLSQYADVMAVCISDPLEKEAPPSGHYVLTDGKNRYVMDTTHPSFCNAYLSSFLEQHQRIEKTLHHYHIPLFQMSTDQSVAVSLYR